MATAAVRHRFTTEEYRRLAIAGVLNEDSPVELLDGDIVEMSPVGSRHVASVNRLDDLLHERLARRSVIIQVQSPVILAEHYEPEPDITVLRFRADYYAEALPRPADVLLLIEVADSSLPFDQDIKLPVYARAGIPEVWIADLDGGKLVSYTNPTTEGYALSDSAGHGAALAATLLPALVIQVDEALGAPG